MCFWLPETSVKFEGLAYGVVGIAVAIILAVRLSRRPNLDAFPTVGPDDLLSPLGPGFKFLISGASIIQEGYAKYKSAPFKVADMYGWVVILSSREHLEEIRKASEDELSFAAAASDRLNTRYTFGDEIHATPYHLAVIRSQLTRNIGALYPGIRDEVTTAFEEVLGLKGDQWKSVSALSAMQKVACRSTNRVFVGLPLCRNPDWIDLNVRYSVNVFKIGLIVGLFPGFIRPLVARLFTAITRDTIRGLRHVGPIIEKRLKHLRECGVEWASRPNDLISWLIEEAEGPELSVKALTTRLLVINFATIHTIAMSITHALFYLAANPHYVQPLREEVELIIEREGWSKAALGKMHRVDSFLRECLRMEGIFTLSIGRKALMDFTLSDGTLIPQGTVISFPAQSLHYDERFYEEANVFKPFRFAEAQGEDEVGSKHQFVSTGIEYLPFGHGKHACPGRFFAATELKTMFAHVVTTYDVKLENGTTRPRSWHFADFISPNPFAKVMFRRRVD